MSCKSQPRKGLFITQKQLEWKNNVSQAAKKRKLSSEKTILDNCIQGRRIIEINKLVEDLWCQLCTFIITYI